MARKNIFIKAYRYIRILFNPIKILRIIVGLLYGAYLTIRYVDHYNCFPAIIFLGGIVSFRIQKQTQAYLSINGRLYVSPWMKSSPTVLRIGKKAKLIIENDFQIGEDIFFVISDGAELRIGGKEQESLSGITCRCIVLVSHSIKIGKDALIAWDTFITDSDWHELGTTPSFLATEIGDHVWIGTGGKILKGVSIENNSVVAAGAVVTRGKYPARSLIAGVPAKIIKQEIPDWHR